MTCILALGFGIVGAFAITALLRCLDVEPESGRVTWRGKPVGEDE